MRISALEHKRESSLTSAKDQKSDETFPGNSEDCEESEWLKGDNESVKIYY